VCVCVCRREGGDGVRCGIEMWCARVFGNIFMSSGSMSVFVSVFMCVCVCVRVCYCVCVKWREGGRVWLNSNPG